MKRVAEWWEASPSRRLMRGGSAAEERGIADEGKRRAHPDDARGEPAAHDGADRPADSSRAGKALRSGRVRPRGRPRAAPRGGQAACLRHRHWQRRRDAADRVFHLRGRAHERLRRRIQAQHADRHDQVSRLRGVPRPPDRHVGEPGAGVERAAGAGCGELRRDAERRGGGVRRLRPLPRQAADRLRGCLHDGRLTRHRDDDAAPGRGQSRLRGRS